MPLHKDVFCHPWSTRCVSIFTRASPSWCKTSLPAHVFTVTSCVPSLPSVWCNSVDSCIPGQTGTEIWLEIPPKKKENKTKTKSWHSPIIPYFMYPAVVCGTPQVVCAKHAVIHWYLIHVVFSAVFRHSWNYDAKYQVPFSSFSAICGHALIKVHSTARRNMLFTDSIVQATSFRGTGAARERSVFVTRFCPANRSCSLV